MLEHSQRHSPVPVHGKTAEEFLKLYKTFSDPFVVVNMRGRITGFNKQVGR